MQIDIEANDIELTPALRAHIEKKISTLSKFLARFEAGSVHVKVEVSRTTRHHRRGEVYYAEANLHFPGGMLRANHQSENIRTAINRVRGKLQREIRKYKTSH